MKNISIIIPVYNGQNYIRQCLDSLNPLKKIVECIIINDGSIDNTKNICKDYISKNDWIKYIETDNNGVSKARNIGIQNSTAEYILFLDADDTFNSFSFNSFFNNIDKMVDLYIFPQKKLTEKDLANVKKNKLIENILFNSKINFKSVWSKIYKLNIIKDNNIKFDTRIKNGEDMLFNIEYSKYIKEYEIENICIYNFNLNISSSSNKYNEKFYESDIIFQKKLRELVLLNTDNDYIYSINGIIGGFKQFLFHPMCSMTLQEKKDYFNKLIKDNYFYNNVFKVRRKIKTGIKYKIIYYLLHKKYFFLLNLMYKIYFIIRAIKYNK